MYVCAFASHRIASHGIAFIASNRIALLRFAPHCIDSYRMASFESHRIAHCIAWHCFTSHRIDSHGIDFLLLAFTLHCIESNRIVLLRFTSHRIDSHRMASLESYLIASFYIASLRFASHFISLSMCIRFSLSLSVGFFFFLRHCAMRRIAWLALVTSWWHSGWSQAEAGGDRHHFRKLQLVTSRLPNREGTKETERESI
jgi:hypothetical protein